MIDNAGPTSRARRTAREAGGAYTTEMGGAVVSESRAMPSKAVAAVIPFIDGFDLIALPRASRLARARLRQLWGWLGAVLCCAVLMLGLEAFGAWRQRIGEHDQRRYRTHLQEQARTLAPAWRDASHLLFRLNQAETRKKALGEFGDRRWALHRLLDALARAATSGLVLQRMHYHVAGKPIWSAAPLIWDSGAVDRSSHLPSDVHRGLHAPDASSGLTSTPPSAPATSEASETSGASAMLHASEAGAAGERLVDESGKSGSITAELALPDAPARVVPRSMQNDALRPFSTDAFSEHSDRSSDRALLGVLPRTAALALTVEGLADDDATAQEWIVRLQGDPRIGAVSVDAFVREPVRPTSSVWGSRLSDSAPKALRSSLIRFRVSVFGLQSGGLR